MIHPLKLVLIFAFSTPIVAFSQRDSSTSTPKPMQGERADLHFAEGKLFVKKHNFQNAFQNFRKARLLAEAGQDWNLYIKSLNALASINHSLSENQQTEIFNWLKMSFLLLKEDKTNKELAELHLHTANFYINVTYEADTTLYHCKEAVRIWVPLLGEWNESVAACYHLMGDVYKFWNNDFLQAEQCYEKALQIREKIQFNDESVLARNYYGLAVTNRSQGDFEKALSYGIKTLELSKKMNNMIYVEMTSYIVANIYRDMGKSDLAKEYYLRAIALNKLGNNPDELAFYYMGLGETLKNETHLDEAIAYFKKALSHSNSDKMQGIHLLYMMGETYLMKKDYSKSLQAFKEQLKELKKLNLMRSRLAYHGFAGLGDYHFSIGQNDSSIFYYQKAMATVLESFKPRGNENPTESMIGYNYYVHGVLDKKANVFHALYSHTNNYTYLQQSLKCLLLAETMLSHERNTLDLEDSKWNFLQVNYNVYEEIIALVFEMSAIKPQDSLLEYAFHYFEQSKARMLADALIQAEQANEIKDNDSLLRKHQDLKRKLFQVEDNLSQEIEKNTGINAGTSLREEMVALDRELQKIKLSIEKNYPGYFGIKYGNFIPSIRALQKSLQNKNQIILEYFWGNKSVYGLGISANKVLLKKLGAVDSIQSITTALMEHFENEKSTTNLNAYDSFVSNSHTIYKMLIESFQPLLSANIRLQIIPDGKISQIPFETLLTQEYSKNQVNYFSLPYLIKNHAIGYAYSSSLLTHGSTAALKKPSLLAMGFTNGEQSAVSISQFQELAGSETELKTLATRFDTGKFLKGSDATEFNFKKLSPNYDILHLAIHGKGDVNENYAASLYFREKTNSIEDGELHAYELYGIKLKAALAVLTACESGIGKDYKGEGMMSMASGFIYAGCDNILMSLWEVNDQASTSLMDNFYANISEGKAIDEALAEAKLNYLKQADELTADPRIWASLVAYGKLNPVVEREERSRIYSVAAISVLIILLLFFIMRKKIMR